MHRYLLNVSYIGTSFRGTQKITSALNKGADDISTVQGCIDFALKKLHPINEIRSVLSSRTDAGVHGLHTAMHVDLQRHDPQPYNPQSVTGVLNRTLEKNDFPIRVMSTLIVPETFHCRYQAKARTYLYRLAVAKQGALDEDQKMTFYDAFVPIDELKRCLFLSKYFRNCSFDIEKMKSAAKLFVGRHDFRTFMNVSSNKNRSRDHPMFTVRTILEINITPGKSLAAGADEAKANELYDYWEIEIKGKSFIYKQVRRIVGTLISTAFDQIDEKRIYEMLTIPSKNSWDPRITLAPSIGLYLCRVHYDEKDLQCSP